MLWQFVRCICNDEWRQLIGRHNDLSTQSHQKKEVHEDIGRNKFHWDEGGVHIGSSDASALGLGGLSSYRKSLILENSYIQCRQLVRDSSSGAEYTEGYDHISNSAYAYSKLAIR